MKKESELIAVLLNSTAREDERDDAAMDLAAFDGNDVIEALFTVATDHSLQSEMIKGSCGESLASIWIRTQTIDLELLSRLEGTAQTEALGSIKMSRSDWYNDFVSQSSDKRMKIQQEHVGYDDVNYIDLKQLYLHDAELGLVTVNYKDHVATVKLCNAGYYDATLLFSKVKHVDVTIDEPWGGGIYVSSVETNKLNGDFTVSILLNSGDEIAVVAEEVTIEGYEDSRPRLPK